MKKFNVYLNGNLIDTVEYPNHSNSDSVKRNLISDECYSKYIRVLPYTHSHKEGVKNMPKVAEIMENLYPEAPQD